MTPQASGAVAMFPNYTQIPSRIPVREALRQLEAEGLELLEERMKVRVTYRGYVIAGQRPVTGDQPTIGR